MNRSEKMGIRLVYARPKATDPWSLVLMDASDGVSRLVKLPHFSPLSTDPKREHIAAVLSALADAKLDGGNIFVDSDDGKTTDEVVIELKKKVERERKAVRINGNHDDEDAVALQELQTEAKRRMGNEVAFKEFYETEVQGRINDPKRLKAEKPKES